MATVAGFMHSELGELSISCGWFILTNTKLPAQVANSRTQGRIWLLAGGRRIWLGDRRQSGGTRRHCSEQQPLSLFKVKRKRAISCSGEWELQLKMFSWDGGKIFAATEFFSVLHMAVICSRNLISRTLIWLILICLMLNFSRFWPVNKFILCKENNLVKLCANPACLVSSKW